MVMTKKNLFETIQIILQKPRVNQLAFVWCNWFKQIYETFKTYVIHLLHIENGLKFETVFKKTLYFSFMETDYYSFEIWAP